MEPGILALYSIFYITFGIICGHIHCSKGYSGIVGFIAGILLPLPVLLIVLLEKENPNRKVNTLENINPNKTQAEEEQPLFTYSYTHSSFIPTLAFNNPDIPSSEEDIET